MQGRTAALLLILAASLLTATAQAQEPASAGTVGGIVTLPNGTPVEGTEVILERFGTRTNSRGVFLFRDVRPGEYGLIVHKPGYPGHARRVCVRPGKSETMIIALESPGDPPAHIDRGRIPLYRAGNAFSVNALLNERREAYFLLDTGASLTVISRALAAELGVTVGARPPIRSFATASGRVHAPLAIVPSIQVGNTVARNVVVAVHDLPFADRLPGILGLSFLSRFTFTIHPQETYMLLHE